jgi:hypothetical protein
MRAFLLLAFVYLATPASGGELCFHDEWFVCCPGQPPCDVYEPMSWIGFRIDEAPCQNFEYNTFAALAISTSQHNPYLNSGPLPDHGRLYVWNVGDGPPGEWWGQFEAYVLGDIPIIAYEPMAGDINVFEPETGRLFFDACVGPKPNVIGAFVVGPGTVGVKDESWGRMKARYARYR